MGVSQFSRASCCPLEDLDFFHLEALPSGMHDLLGPRDRWSIPCSVFKFQAWIRLMSLTSLFLISHWPEMVTWLHPHSGARKWMAGHGYLESANKFCQDGKRDIVFAVPKSTVKFIIKNYLIVCILFDSNVNYLLLVDVISLG